MTEDRLKALWDIISRGEASPEHCIEAIALTGRANAVEFAPLVRRLLSHRDSEVREYAMRTLAEQFSERSSDLADCCWWGLFNDPDVDVRTTAASCLGLIYRGTRDRGAFGRLKQVLATQLEHRSVRGRAYNALFEIVGRPARDWPSSRRMDELDTDAFVEDLISGDIEVDWDEVSALERETTDSPEKPSLSDEEGV